MLATSRTMEFPITESHMTSSVPVSTTRTGKSTKIQTNGAYYQAVKFTSDCFVVVGWNNKISFYSSTETKVSEHDISRYYPKNGSFPVRVNCMDISPDYTTLAIGGTDGLVHVFNISSGSFTHLFTFDHMIHEPNSKIINSYTNKTVESVCWTKDSRYLYVGGGHYVYKVKMDRQIDRVFTLIKTDNVNVNTIKVSKDRVVIGTWNNYLYIFDHDGNIFAQEHLCCFVRAIGISEDSNIFYVSVGNKPNPVLIKYNLESGAMINMVSTKSESWINSIAVHGDLIYLASNDNAVYRYSKDVIEYIGHDYFGFYHTKGVEVSPDGTKLIAFDHLNLKVIY